MLDFLIWLTSYKPFRETPSTNLKASKPWFFGGKVQPLRQKQVPLGSHEEIEEDGNQDVWHAKIIRFIRFIRILEGWTQPLFGGNGTCLQAHGSSVGPASVSDFSVFTGQRPAVQLHARVKRNLGDAGGGWDFLDRVSPPRMQSSNQSFGWDSWSYKCNHPSGDDCMHPGLVDPIDSCHLWLSSSP